MNWRAYMRLDKMFLKMFQIEPRVPIRLLIDTSASMAAGDGSKFLYARQLAAALAYVGLVRHDMISIYPFSSHLGEGKRTGGGRHQFSTSMKYFESLTAKGKTDFEHVVREFIGTFSQRGLLIIISDFLDEADCERALQYLGDFGHELFLIQLWTGQDRTPPWSGELELEDGETGNTVRLQFDDSARRNYTSQFDAFTERIEHLTNRNNGKYVGVSTELSLDEIVFGSLIRARGVA